MLVSMKAPGSITVVIPSLNEEAWIRAAVGSATAGAMEVIVVDGGSTDATVAVARAAGARVVVAPRGRAAQLESGTVQATGEWLVFLHADTRLEAGWADALGRLDAAVVGGAFRFSLDSPRRRYRLVETAVWLRCALLGLPYGDQGLFVRRSVLGSGGVFGNVPILEDVDLVRRLRREGRLAFLPVRAVTSPRRWEERGFWRTTLVNWYVLMLDAMGMPRERLARIYGVRGA
jgi:rSAM/selenodomain-associated transferase 2